jgi:hypothetical protein
MGMMRSTRTLVLLACIAVVLAMALAPAASAARPGGATPVSGGWSWVNTGWNERTLPGGSHLATGDETGAWTGTFVGSSIDVFAMQLMPPFDYEHNLYGPGWGTLKASFTGTVAGRSGAMTMLFTIYEPANDPVMVGSWVIVHGTGELACARGSGTWVSSGIDSSATYSGTVCWR